MCTSNTAWMKMFSHINRMLTSHHILASSSTLTTIVIEHTPITKIPQIQFQLELSLLYIIARYSSYIFILCFWSNISDRKFIYNYIIYIYIYISHVLQHTCKHLEKCLKHKHLKLSISAYNAWSTTLLQFKGAWSKNLLKHQSHS